MNIGEKIRYIRDKEDLKQVDFCKETGISNSTLRNYESGRRTEISSKELVKITNHPRFKKYTMFLMTDDSEDPNVNELSNDEFVRMFAELSDDKAEQTMEYMKFLLSQEQK